MRQLRSCGVLVFREQPRREFLLMKHADRWDLPKGHIDAGETDLQCALRELEEETGISAAAVRLDPEFRFEHRYIAPYSARRGGPAAKTLVVFLGWLERDAEVQLTEHVGYEWTGWNPPHRIQEKTIDPLLAAVERHFQHV